MIQGRPCLIPAGVVSRIIQYDVAPLPLSRRPVSGLGIYEAGIVVSLQLFDAEIERARRSVTGALFTFARPRCRFALEIAHVVSSVRVGGFGAPSAKWFVEAQTIDGRTLPWLLVDRMLAELGAGIAE